MRIVSLLPSATEIVAALGFREELEILAEILHPEEFDFGYRGKGWEPLGRL